MITSMKTTFLVLVRIIKVIAVLVFAAGMVLTALGVYDFYHALSHFGEGAEGFQLVGGIAVGLLRGVDLFLIAIVFFVFSLGLLILFNNKAEESMLHINLPDWLRIKNFIQLKVLLWEAVLTTLVVSFLTGLVNERINGSIITTSDLILPGAILLIAISLYFLKKGEGEGH
jgi:uncharacterized membrane protein YqhA